jgi:uncharacterized RDD family membrane protein YckC
MVSENNFTRERRAELESAFRGANSLLFLLVFLVFTFLPVVWLYSKMTGWMQVSGLVLLSLFTAFILMLFVSGILKLLLRRLFMMVSPEYRQMFEDQEPD